MTAISAISGNNAEHYKWENGSDGWYLLNSDLLSVIQERVPLRESECRHFHNNSQQFFYVLSGTAQIEISGITYNVGRGHGIHIAAKEAHQLKNSGSVDLEFLFVSEPMSHGDRVNT
ncbi:MAG: cupin domain-containing protein [Zhongshania sp.]|uniref:cupin domain-containing protein n=1 Tax=Zhongshania sp. TaxID=1971902 RepID=UPI002636D1E7|nr:cupin domain-containing protein [Zhongshania sp.]MDF1693244.1 cupin domain-containing protein [Zhongshania sp.]